MLPELSAIDLSPFLAPGIECKNPRLKQFLDVPGTQSHDLRLLHKRRWWSPKVSCLVRLEWTEGETLVRCSVDGETCTDAVPALESALATWRRLKGLPEPGDLT